MHRMKWSRGGVCPPWDTEGSKPGAKRIAEGLRLFYQRHLAQVTITCRPAAPAGRHICIWVCIAFVYLYRTWPWARLSGLRAQFTSRSYFLVFNRQAWIYTINISVLKHAIPDLACGLKPASIHSLEPPNLLRVPICGQGLNLCRPWLSLTHLISNYMTKELILA